MGVPEGKSPVVMLSDARGDLSEALGLIGYLGRALGVRSKRFALVLENGIVKYKAVDEGTDNLTDTSAEAVLKFVEANTGVQGFVSKAAKGAIEAIPLQYKLGAGAFALLYLYITINF